ncbi:MAG: hypothetical protein MI863_16430 [Desulfobacterales bacterium]|nr:hypothetical protein [Desulfobacterales bacterium]
MIAKGKDVTKTLTDPERIRLEECECIIRRGLCTFLEVGRALAEIHDNRLYKETHKSFQKYCKDVWDLGKTTAEQKMNGYKVVSLLEKKMPAIAGTFTNECQTRPLTRLKKNDDRLKACKLVQEKLEESPRGKLTGALVNKAVKEVQGKVGKKKVKETKKAMEKTDLLSNQFKNQHQVMLDIIVDAKDNGTCKQSEMVKWLKTLVKIAESDD